MFLKKIVEQKLVINEEQNSNWNQVSSVSSQCVSQNILRVHSCLWEEMKTTL